MQKEQIFALELKSFGIRPLTLWVSRLERHNQDPANNATPKTVRDLVRKYHYRFFFRRSVYVSSVWGLGKEPFFKLKEKLEELGLSPDDWPALVPHKELLKHLSKQAIMKMPAQEVFPSRDYDEQLSFYSFFGWVNSACEVDEQSRARTVQDLVQYNPTDMSRVAVGLDSARFFASHKQFFITLRHKLADKGFTRRDGDFFKWNPSEGAYKKAQKLLGEYNLSPAEIIKFSAIAVERRWVI
jgi:hypothetical protein